MLNPSKTAAVIGGNTLTCQRVVDVVFKAFDICAASQVANSSDLVIRVHRMILGDGSKLLETKI